MNFSIEHLLLGPRVMPLAIEDIWKEVSQRYTYISMYIWNFPNCVGAIDGKNISIRCPIGGC
jgi:hypothetical protein